MSVFVQTYNIGMHIQVYNTLHASLILWINSNLIVNHMVTEIPFITKSYETNCIVYVQDMSLKMHLQAHCVHLLVLFNQIGPHFKS